jgi:hypothetical protein
MARYVTLCDDNYDADGIAALFTEDDVLRPRGGAWHEAELFAAPLPSVYTHVAGSDTIARASATEDVDCGEGRAACADRSAFRLHVRVTLPVRH